MELTSDAASPLSLLAPIIAIGLAILTRRVMLSLGLGIVSGALLLNDFSPLVTLHYLWQQLVAVSSYWKCPAAELCLGRWHNRCKREKQVF